MSVITDDENSWFLFSLLKPPNLAELHPFQMSTNEIDADGGISPQYADGGGIDAHLSSVYTRFATVDFELICRLISQGAEVLSWTSLLPRDISRLQARYIFLKPINRSYILMQSSKRGMLVASSLVVALLALASWNAMYPRPASSLLQDIMKASPESTEYAHAEALFQVNICANFSEICWRCQ